MRTCFEMAHAASRGTWFALIVVFSISTSAQTPRARDHSKSKTTPTPSLEKKFIVNILHDQRAIWTSPFRWRRTDAKWLVPLGLSTVALIATDRRTSGELVENGDNLNRLRISKNISRLGSFYSTGGVAGVLYLTGRATHN
ncbi:MAG: hypothetical protein M3R52_07565, partial [Acidobacteriota bacterium]|nr:hypothetical protein [Acidobacteriota bacterium]